MNEVKGEEKKKKNGSPADRLPPNAIEVEMAVLGAMMLDQEAAARVFEILDETCFFKDAHRKVFLAAQRLYQRNDPIDLVTVTEALNATRELEASGDAAYLAELVGMVASPANAEHHARIVLRKSLLRKLIHSCTRAIETCYQEPDDVDDLLDGVENEIFHLMQFRKTGGFRPIGPLLVNTFEKLENVRADKDGVIGVHSGFSNLDKLTSGFQAGDMIVLAGRPSMGKTAFSLNLARNAAVEHRVPVGYFSLEMAAHQLALRMLCAEAGVDSALLRTGKLDNRKFQKLPLVIGKLAEAPLYIDDTPALSVMELRARARRLKSEFNIGLVIIDYLGLMESSNKKVENQQQKVAEISRSLKALAKDLEVPVIVLSQLSRAVEMRPGDKRPILSDLRDSGAIEQDADVVMFLYREGVYKEDADKSYTEVIIAKQRNGPLGVAKVKFDLQTGRFLELAPEHIQAMEVSGDGGYPF
ncbi:MAG: replicative DNA helicase [Candidatus Zixiibacteriota bacterium]|nr:MAG: replicative DNA helicase [candidate division Zixibacteria bacterium]